MNARRSGAVMIAFSVIMLAVVWRFVPPGAPPLYDSVCGYPVYHFLSPPAGAAPAPTAAPVSTAVALTNGQQPVMTVMTDEGESPQAQLIANTASVVPPAGAQDVTVAITPVPPPAAPPPGGAFDSNVYRFSVTASGRELTIVTPVTVVLATATDDSNPRTLEQYVNGRWTALDTVAVACNNSWGSSVHSLGDFVLVRTQAAQGAPPPQGGSSGSVPAWLITLAGLVAGGGAIALARRRRTGV